MRYDEYRNKSILHYLQTALGIIPEFRGKFYICSSPLSRDTTPSFTIYPDNRFKCWSTGNSGDIMALVKLVLQISFREALKYIDSHPNLFIEYEKNTYFSGEFKKSSKPFDYVDYLNNNEKSVHNIFSYCNRRKITTGFLPGCYWTRKYLDDGSYTLVRNDAVMFLHTDLNNNICGAKFRNIDDTSSPRFTARGRLGFYILGLNGAKKKNDFKNQTIWICESETSSNSLWSILNLYNVPATVISMGGVASAPKILPYDINFLQVKRKLVIDYDGNEELYQTRIKKYEHLNVEPVKMILPKGEDINSIYVNNKVYLIEHLLFN